jgi:hypothetical protein
MVPLLPLTQITRSFTTLSPRKLVDVPVVSIPVLILAQQKKG